MKCLALGLTLIAVCHASTSDATVHEAEPRLMLFPPPPELLPQPLQPGPISRLEASESLDARALIRAAARKHRVPAAFVTSIVAAESNFDPSAISPKGAIGLMQLMPATAQLFGADANIPEQNIDAGTRYLRVLMDRYHKYRNSLRRVIAAYNAGPGVVDRYHGVPPFRETQNYVARVLALMKKFQRERA